MCEYFGRVNLSIRISQPRITKAPAIIDPIAAHKNTPPLDFSAINLKAATYKHTQHAHNNQNSIFIFSLRSLNVYDQHRT
jgi:hypothetical protein